MHMSRRLSARIPALAAALFSTLAAMAAGANSPPAPRFAVYYTDTLPASAFFSYDVLVFDSHAHPDLAPLKARGKKIFGYLSLGEAADYRHGYRSVENEGLLLKNSAVTSWGSRVIDVRKPQWAAYVVEELIPDLVRRGFDGLMLDTLDTAEAVEALDPAANAGMRMAMARLVRLIRLHYPNLKIMVNRGFSLLPEIAEDIDAVLAESIYTVYDTKTGEHRLQPEEHYRSVSEMLQRLHEEYPKIAIYTLDYWPETDGEAIRAIYAAQRAQGFIPYVSTHDLQQLREEAP